jgi:hypothetical protein
MRLITLLLQTELHTVKRVQHPAKFPVKSALKAFKLLQMLALRYFTVGYVMWRSE